MNTRVKRKERAGIVTEELFNAVKELIKYGVKKPTQLAEITKLGKSTIGRMKNCETYEDYKKKVKELSLKAKESKAVKEPSEEINVDVSELINVPEPIDAPKPIDVLERIACTLERLADAWEAHPKAKTGLFR